MRSLVVRAAIGFILGAFLVSSVTLAQLGASVPDWPHPTSQTLSHRGAITTMGDVTEMLPFIGVTPCRIVDTRGPAGPFGAPAIAGGTSRNFALPSGPCAGIPVGVSAYSLNITATNTAGPGFIKVWPEGATQPLVSTLNYVAGQTVANAAIVPAGTGGGITVKAGVSTADVIIDINGYYSGLTASGNPFRLVTNNSGPSMSLTNNSASCVSACGVYQAVMGFNSEAIVGVTNGTGAGIGVLGQTNTTADLSAGVYGFGGAGFGAGITFGVLGDDRSPSNDSAGVKGTDGSGAPSPIPTYSPAGVRGDSASNYGMLGVSRYLGVNGSVIDTGGTELAPAFSRSTMARFTGFTREATSEVRGRNTSSSHIRPTRRR